MDGRCCTVALLAVPTSLILAIIGSNALAGAGAGGGATTEDDDKSKNKMDEEEEEDRDNRRQLSKLFDEAATTTPTIQATSKNNSVSRSDQGHRRHGDGMTIILVLVQVGGHCRRIEQ